ncbi:2'-5'-oligoadenylate synthase 1A [Folsomia candida]|uniref:2'-5'-oligoadenylate synthase 1A n=1 Tax=Folsomia candida TaxID=158441 RepID=UPI000B90375C|nr:2'-5'-oligoadenylate synthase 1A [Folsomia candida]
MIEEMFSQEPAFAGRMNPAEGVNDPLDKCMVIREIQDHGAPQVGGSMGKGTAIGDTDFDVVVFLNDHEPPFRQRIFDKMLAALKTVRGYSFIKKTRYSIRFKIRINRLTLDFDLLPAQNLLDHAKHSSDMARQQAVEVRHRMGNFARPSVFSTSLAEQTILFMKKKPDDVVKVIKLARHWNQQIRIDEKVHGRSYMVELVAAWAQKDQPVGSLFERFVRFLREMEDFSNLRIFFGHHYCKFSIPEDVWKQTPLVMDPCNPYNNLAEGITPDVIENFQSAATRSLAMIKNGLKDVEDLFFATDESDDDQEEKYDNDDVGKFDDKHGFFDGLKREYECLMPGGRYNY